MTPKKPKKTPSDPNQLAAFIVGQNATGKETPEADEPTPEEIAEIIKKAKDEGKDPLAVLLGKRGGLKGGKARAAKLTSKKRSQIAKKAARARWRKEP